MNPMTAVDVDNAVRHVGKHGLPSVDATGGNLLKVLRVNADARAWLGSNRLARPVEGFGISARWHFREYDFCSAPGS
jgi:hypothetical protein